MESKKKVENKKNTGVRRTTKSSVTPKRTVKTKKVVKPTTNVKKTTQTNDVAKKPLKPTRVSKKSIEVKTKRTIKGKRIIILLIVIILIIFALIKIVSKPDKKETTDKLVYNKNESFIKQQKIDGVVFKNINCSYDGKNSLISYTVVNETNKMINLSNYDVLVKDKNKVVITKIVANVEQKLEPKKGVNMANSVVGVDLTDAYYMELKLKIDDVKSEKKQ